MAASTLSFSLPGPTSRRSMSVLRKSYPEVCGNRRLPVAMVLVEGAALDYGMIGYRRPFLGTRENNCFGFAVELAVISYVRYRYMDTPFLAAAFQVVIGGVLVFIAGIVIGSA
jgi:hypothetical protein